MNMIRVYGKSNFYNTLLCFQNVAMLRRPCLVVKTCKQHHEDDVKDERPIARMFFLVLYCIYASQEIYSLMEVACGNQMPGVQHLVIIWAIFCELGLYKSNTFLSIVGLGLL